MVISANDVGKTCQVNQINYCYTLGRFGYFYQLTSGTVMFFRVWFQLLFYVFTNGASPSGNVVIIAPWRQCNPTDVSVPGPHPR